MQFGFKLVASLLVGMMECTLFGTGRAVESGRTIFVSATSGQDANDGLTPQTPLRSLARVNAAELRPADRVLFQRGGSWRGQLVSQSGREGAPVTYGAYGQGARPVLLGSISRSQINDWTDGLTLDRNCWFQTTGVLMQFLRTRFTASQFTEYQKQARLDAHSIVANPRFVNGAALDSRLTKDSPARKLGAAGGLVGAAKRLDK